MPSERHRLSVERLTLSSAATSAVVIRATIGSAFVVMIMAFQSGTGFQWSVVGVSASPQLDGLVSVSVVKGACGVAMRFAALTRDPRSSDQGIGWSSGEAETWRGLVSHREPVQLRRQPGRHHRR